MGLSEGCVRGQLDNDGCSKAQGVILGLLLVV